MTDKPSSKSESRLELLDAIEMYEQLLESMPDDIPTLEELLHLSEDIGDRERIKKYTIQLLRLNLDLNRISDALALAPRLKDMEAESEDIARWLSRLAELSAKAPSQPRAETPPAARPAAAPAESLPSPQQALQAELEMAWHMHDRKWVAQEEYGEWVQDLTELTARAGPRTTVSLLHVLSGRSHPKLEELLLNISKDARVPYVALSRYDTPASVAGMIPPAFIRRMGVAPFERMGKEILVAVLNPFNDRLRASVAAQLGHRCHFYLTSAPEFDKWAEKYAPLTTAAKET